MLFFSIFSHKGGDASSAFLSEQRLAQDLARARLDSNTPPSQQNSSGATLVQRTEGGNLVVRGRDDLSTQGALRSKPGAFLLLDCVLVDDPSTFALRH